MFLPLAYKEVELVSLSKQLVQQCYELARSLPQEEKENLTQHIRQSALTFHLTISEGAFTSSRKRRNKQYKLAQLSLVQLDAAIEVAVLLGNIDTAALGSVPQLLLQSYEMLDKLMCAK